MGEGPGGEVEQTPGAPRLRAACGPSANINQAGTLSIPPCCSPRPSPRAVPPVIIPSHAIKVRTSQDQEPCLAEAEKKKKKKTPFSVLNVCGFKMSWTTLRASHYSDLKGDAGRMRPSGLFCRRHALSGRLPALCRLSGVRRGSG